MIINMIELLHLIKKRQLDRKYIGQPFGSAIKYKRKELGLTLEEASEDICSISYLSKVENNTISASDEFVEKFKDRFELVDAYDYDLETYKKHLDQVIDGLIKDKEINKSFITYYENRVDYQSIIITFAYHILRKDYIESNILYYQVLSMISSMPQTSFIISMLLMNHIFYHYMNYKDGMRIISILETQKPYSNDIQLLINKWKLMYAFKLSDHHLIYKTYKTYENDLIERHLFDQLKKINFLKLIYDSKSSNLEKLKENVNSISSMESYEKAYIIAMCHYHKGHYEKALNLAISYHNASDDWRVLHLLILDKMGESRRIKEILKQNDIISYPLLTLINKHLSYKYFEGQNEIVSYIKNDILTRKIFTDDYDILNYLMKDCEKILSGFQYYKDAVYIYRFFNRQLSQKA
jgi:HTH-type transcriptional regulator, quorum sensing regulator NprR